MISLPRALQGLSFAVAASLAACSGTGNVPSAAAPSGIAASAILSQRANPMARVKSWMRPLSAKSSLTYVSDAYGGVYVFDQAGKLQGELTGFAQPAGIYVDKHHNLWVTDLQSETAAVTEFARGGTAPIRTLDDTAGVPYDVTVCPNGTAFVSNYQSNDPPAGRHGAQPDAARGSVEVFPKNSETPTRYMQYPDQLVGEFITCDKNDNVFTTLFYGASQSAVIEYPHGRGSGVMLPITLAYVGGVKAEDNGDILVGDQAGHNITEYTESGVATGITINTSNAGDVQQFAVTKNGKTLGAADSQDKQGDTWSFPGGTPGKPYSDANFGYPTGFAYDPPAKP